MNHKKALLAVAVLLTLGGTTAAIALNKDEPTPRPVIANVDSQPKQEETTAPVAEDGLTPVAPQPTVATPTPQAPTPTPQPSIEEQNKTKIMALITDRAKALNFDDNGVWRQTFCFDKLFTDSGLYGDYNAMVNHEMVKQYLDGLDGRYAYFGGSGTCGVSYFRNS